MSNPPKKNPVYEALKTIMVAHVIGSIMFISFSFYVHHRQPPFFEDEALTAKLLSKIRAEQDLEKLRSLAIEGWRADFLARKTISTMAEDLGKGTMCLCLVSVGIAVMALSGLRAQKKLKEADTANLV